MMKPAMVRYTLMVIIFFISLPAQAMSIAECGSLRTDRDFAFSFDVQNGQGSEYAGLFYNLNLFSFDVWSAQPRTQSSALFNDSVYLGLNKNYRVWISYQSLSSNAGIFSYYRYANSKWTLIGQESVYFGLLLLNVNLGYYSSGVNNFACDNNMIFPPNPPVEFEKPLVCDIFPQPAQSWVTNGTRNYNLFTQNFFRANASSVRINGFSERFIKDNRVVTTNAVSEHLKIGFDTINTSAFSSDSRSTNICQGIGCAPEDLTQKRKIAPPPLINNTYSAAQEVTLVDGRQSFNLLGLIVADDPNSYRRLCSNSTNNTSAMCTYVESSTTNRVDVFIQRDLRVLNINAFVDKLLVVHFKDKIKIEHLIFEGNVAAYFDQNSTTNFSTITSGVGALMAFESGAWINISDAALHNIELQMDHPVRFFYIGESSANYQYPVFYGPLAGFKIQSDQNISNGVYKGYLLGNWVELTSSTRVDGAVTALELTMSGSANIQALNGKNQCSVPITNNYTLQMTPAESYSLSCNKQTIQIQVSNEDGTPATNYTGSIIVSPADGLTVAAGSGGSGSNGVFKPNNNGLLELELTAGQTKDIQIAAYLSTQEISKAKRGIYHFVPYTFAVDHQAVIANKPKAINMKVLSCDKGGNAVDIGYKGTPNYTSQWIAPVAGQGSLSMSNLEFTDGQAAANLIMTDSGIQQVTISDDNFNCQQFGNKCPIKGAGKLQGSFEVYSRPWTFAICPVNGANNMDGNISDAASSKFAAAGDNFDVLVKPLRWSSGESVTESILSNSASCALPMTDNFFDANVRLATQVSLVHTVAQPSGGQPGQLTQIITTEQGTESSTTDISLANTQGTRGSGIAFNQLSWSEVGVLRLIAQTKNDGGYVLPEHKIQHGYRNVGRFAPHHFTLVSNGWNYANDHSGFAYMDQPIKYNFLVDARSRQQQVTQNYAAFPAALKSDISVYALHDNASLMNRVSTNPVSWNGDVGQWSDGSLAIANAGFTFAKQNDPIPVETSSAVTIPDGPYREGFGLEVTNIVDDVTFDLGSQVAFPQQPDFRYGRLQLADVGGNSDEQITVPVEAQYWDGQQFVINTDDSGSQFGVENTTESVICVDIPQTFASLNLAPTLQTVGNGIGEGLSAQQSDSENRGQVRFWMRIADNSVQLNENDVVCGDGTLVEPWLQFNWRGKGDEDPSTLITFGVYRGNDRIIYRGEPRINN